jgi:uncharacterized lipoprotein YmbA
MMANSVARILLIAFVMAALGACATTSPSRFFTLDVTASAEGAPDAGTTVLVGPITLPASVAPNRVDFDEFNRWAAPLDDNIARVVAGNLTVLLGSPRVARAPFANFDPAYRVTIDVQRFESVPGESALVEALWTVRKTADGQTRSGHTLAREAVQGKGFDALAAAHSRALAQVSRDIATAIRSEQDSKR